MPVRRESLDRMFESVSHHHRRRLLAALEEQSVGENPPSVDALSETIARDDDDAERVQMQVLHRHLPKLEDFGYVSWDRAAGTVRRGPEWTDLEPVLELLEDYRTELVDESAR